MPRADDALPDFFVLGVAKGGTTSLHDYLRRHPALFLPYAKELHFFDADTDRFPDGLDRYLQYFSGADAALTGEATASYFRNGEGAAERMRRLYDDAPPRFLILLRDPVRRAYSHYLHNVSEGREPLSFEEALEAERAAPEKKKREWKAYFGDGVYADALQIWFDAFPRDRFCILRSDTLARNTDRALHRIFRFLGVDPDVPIDTERRLNQTGEQQSRALGALLSRLPVPVSSGGRGWVPESVRLWIEQFIRRRNTGDESDRPSLAPSLERNLRRRYDPHIRRLEALLDRDFSAWRPDASPSDAVPSDQTDEGAAE